jgi:hypothetical protein
MLAEIRTGPVVTGDGSINPARNDRQGGLVIANGHALMHEANFRGTLFTYGLKNTALVTANATATGVTATAQPVIGIWNPPTSGINAVIYKVMINHTTVANSAVACNGFEWLVSTNQGAITTGSTPFNCKSLAQAGSSVKAFSVSTALTGLSGSLVSMRGVAVSTTNAAGASTAVTLTVSPIEEYLDGSLICPPGGVLVVMNTTSTTSISVNTSIVWEEVPA